MLVLTSLSVAIIIARCKTCLKCRCQDSGDLLKSKFSVQQTDQLDKKKVFNRNCVVIFAFIVHLNQSQNGNRKNGLKVLKSFEFSSEKPNN